MKSFNLILAVLFIISISFSQVKESNKNTKSSSVPTQEIVKGTRAMKTEAKNKLGVATTIEKDQKSKNASEEKQTQELEQNRGWNDTDLLKDQSDVSNVPAIENPSKGNKAMKIERTKKQGTATSFNKGENKARKAEAIDDEGSVSSKKPVDD